MIRLSVLTAIGLTLLSLFMNWMVSDPTLVSWQECRVQARELSVTLTNSGRAEWDGYMLRARVYADDTLFAGTAPRKMPKQAVGEARATRLVLDRVLPAGREYRVEIFLQRGQEPVVEKSFTIRVDSDGERLQEAALPKLGSARDGVGFPEIWALRTSFPVIDIGRTMGIRRANRIGLRIPGLV